MTSCSMVGHWRHIGLYLNWNTTLFLFMLLQNWILELFIVISPQINLVRVTFFLKVFFIYTLWKSFL